MVSRRPAATGIARLTSFGVPAKLTTFPGAVHVPFAQYGAKMTKQSVKFVYKQLDLAHAAG